MNLTTLYKVDLLISDIWGKATKKYIESFGVNFNEGEDTHSLLERLNETDESSLIRIINVLLVDHNFQRKYDSGWNINYVPIAEIVESLFKLLKDDGYVIKDFQIDVDEKEFAGITKEIIENKFVDDKFYADLRFEINKSHRVNHSIVTSFLIRKLLENLIIDLLRCRYGTDELSLFYDKVHGKFQGFSILVGNLRNKEKDLRPYTSSLNEKFFENLNKFKETGNSSVHSIDFLLEKKWIEDEKTNINHTVNLLCDVIQKIKEDPSIR